MRYKAAIVFWSLVLFFNLWNFFDIFDRYKKIRSLEMEKEDLKKQLIIEVAKRSDLVENPVCHDYVYSFDFSTNQWVNHPVKPYLGLQVGAFQLRNN